MEATPRARPASRLVVPGLIGVAVAVLWLLPMASSLWLDEAGSWWVIRDGLSSTFDRGIDATGQSPLYYVVLWAWTRIAGTSEIALRLPSLLATGAAGWLLFRLGGRLFDRRAAAYAVLAFVTFGGFGSVAFAAADARPYALGLLGVVASTLLLVRWLERRRPADAAAYGTALTLTVYIAYPFAIVALAHGTFLLARARSNSVPWAQTKALIAGLAIAMVPALVHLASIFRRPNILSSVPFTPSARTLLPIAIIVAGAFAGVAAARATTRGASVEPRPTDPAAWPLLVAWTLLPVGILLALSIAVSAKFFYARYWLSAMPGLALAGGWLLASLQPARARRVAAVVVVALALLAHGRATHTNEDWRAAAEIARDRPGAALLLRSGFAGSSPDRLRDPQVIDLVRSPLTYHGVEAEALLVPFRLEGEAVPYLDALLDRAAAEPTVLLISRAPFLGVDEHITTRLEQTGFGARVLLRTDVRATVYTRP